MGLQTRNLVQQGYTDLSAQQLRSLEWGLRFTPTICMLGSIYGLITHNVPLLLGLAAVGVVPFWFPNHHPMDRFYNGVVAPMLGATRLPSNPLPRRIACFAGGSMNFAAAGALAASMPTLAYVIGGMLFVLQLIVNTTHFCVASFGIEWMLRLTGRALPTKLVDVDEAQAMVEAGALLLDVRDRSEHELGHIEGARNVPLSELKETVAELRDIDRPVLVYCRSGARANLAIAVLSRGGVGRLYNVGGMDRWVAGAGA